MRAVTLLTSPTEALLPGFVPEWSVIISVVGALLLVSALVSVLNSRLDGPMKALWIVISLVVPFVGPALWFLVGRPKALSR
ncbi:PLD nuclease N-terminal domain-containing protein [Nocardiopsis quinghaiensis]|uniref:PLD nuclease N-terminal domain-containing protein n=1 Tax=Nocardiopsis quinghaiensis TaxID=464995 RepID=UPI00123A3F1D|nr:PLD nuclease N-terminal domain-containing protein [Nocardiopsis quinghaiensis]